MSSKLFVKRLSQHATLPQRGSIGAAGYDLTSCSEILIPSRGRVLIPTDLSLVLPNGTYGRIAPRSGLALKNGLDVGGGVIDADYRGPVGVVMFNHSDVDYQIRRGDRIAQLIIEKIETPEIQEINKLEDTVRGESGFGSTGTGELIVNSTNNNTKRKWNEEEKTNQ